MTVGERIKELRQEKGYTLLQLAEQIGVSEATMQRYESGKIKNISPDTLSKLAVALGTTGSWLLGEHEKDLSGKSNVVSISTTEKLLIMIYRSLTDGERQMVRELMFTLNYHHSDISRLKFELDLAEDFIDSTEYSDEYTDHKNKVLDETDLSEIDPAMPIHAAIFDAIRQTNPEKAAEYASHVEPDPEKDGKWV